MASSDTTAKVSVDAQLLAIQYTKTSVFVIDTVHRKKWKIDIKYFSGNEILPNGLIWSDHGGNSQDLVIVTTRGLELYKVSLARGQCKLSRYMSIKTHFFWFEPNFRVILVGVTTNSYSLELNGFFLRFDMSDMPRLELPAPDKMPSFTLDGKAGPDDVKMVTLYGQLYCAVHYSEEGGDVLSLYHLSRSKVEKTHTFPLYVSSSVKLSVTDNLLCCHCLQSNMSFLFDISLSRVVSEKRVDYCCGACTLTVDDSDIRSDSGRSFERRRTESLPPPSSTPPSVPIDPFDVSTPPGLPRTGSSASVTQSQSHPVEEWSDAVGVGGDAPVDMDGGVQFPRSRLASVASSAGGSITGTSSGIRHSRRMESRPSDVSITSADVDGGIQNHVKRPHSPRSLSTPTHTGSCARHALEPYAGHWQVLSPYWVWDPHGKRLWKVKCHLPSIVISLHDPRRTVAFLSMRGNPVVAPRPAFYSDYEDGFEAKKQLLRRMKGALQEESLPSTWLETLFEDLCKNYALEYHNRNTHMRPEGDGGGRNSRRFSGIDSGGTDAEKRGSGTRQETAECVEEGMDSSVPPVADSSTPVTQHNKRLNSFLSAFSRSSNEECGKDMIRVKRASTESQLLTRSVNLDGKSSPINHTPGQQHQLFLHSSTSGEPNRRVSVNSQMIAAAHASRMNEVTQLQSTGDAGIGIHTPYVQDQAVQPLEPSLAVHVFFPDISSIGARTFSEHSDLSSRPAGPMSAPPPITVERNEQSYLVCTQTEVLSYVFLPLALKAVETESLRRTHGIASVDSGDCSGSVSTCNSTISTEELTWNLMFYISTLRTFHVAVNVSLSLLLVNLMSFQRRFLDIAHTVQLQFLTDSPELSMTILDIADSLEENMTDSKQHFPPLYHNMVGRDGMEREWKHAIAAMQQAGIDMLWRLQEKTSVVRWMLAHGRVSDAMMLCTKVKGQWRPGLSPVALPGLDFFRAAMSELCWIKQSGHLNSSSRCSLVDAGRKAPSWKRSVFRSSSKRHDSMIIGSESFSTEQQGVQLLHAVHKFLSVWDPSLLSIQKVTGKSRLASMAHFPDDIFSNDNTSELKKLFGFVL
eukprot:CAMPEP_0185039892 /NCGR_PEP_ID=MMETSP1103-20130426/37291_1 /TAXON_ID=36769 /ORGANISM="Paraphysomonas bandaiensis, Strain Caron Lab Isolate" /LENGTH=1082 /DNA_ID=CAMNT_0027578961 /DNA_START=251 /DNA_END=3500 /DNA_ORIENTATION=-